jgi:hypothetical protein
VWTDDKLTKIDAAEEIQIAPRRADGTLFNPVTIWVVRVGNALYIRSYKGSRGAWFRGAQECHAGRIWAGGVEIDVAFVAEPDAAINDRIDAAYRVKYRRSQYAESMLTPEVRATTIRITPLEPRGE